MPEEKQAQEQAEIINVNDDQQKENSSAFKAYCRIFTYGDKYDYALYGVAAVLSSAAGAALALVNIVFGGFVTNVTDYAAGRSSRDDFLDAVDKFALYFVYLAIGRFCTTYLYTVCATLASIRVSQNLRYAYFRATLSQEIAFFDAGQGSISIALTTNGNLIQQGTADKLGLTVQALAAFIASFIVAFISSWKLTLIVSCIAPFMVLVTGTAVAIDAKWEERIMEIYAKAGAYAEDAFSSMRTIHAFWARHRLGAKYQVYLDQAYEIARWKSPVYGAMFSCEFFAIYAAFALAFWQGIRMFARGEIEDTGTVVVVLFSVVVAATSFTQIAPNIMAFTSASSSASILFKTIDRASKINPYDQNGLQPEKVVGDLELDGVNFAYPTRPDSLVLKDYTLKIPANKVTALVGASGSGKSTIIGLLERWYDPTSGEVKLDGVSLKDLNIHWLRTHLRLVQQEPVLFNGTVFENVRFGLIGTQFEHVSETEQRKLVEDACALANAHEFVSTLPEGYNTQIGERAGMLSGGQKQRLAIARSVVSNPSVLLLDEATSALDPHAEGIVQRALDKASRNRTTIVIAHKLATIKNADNIVVMTKGQIVEQGTHESLIEADGTYARLVRIQDLGKATENRLAESDEVTEESGSSIEPSKSLTKYPTSKAAQLQAQRDRDDFDKHKYVTLFKAIWMLFNEQTEIFWWRCIEIVGCIIGGGAYPAQAILFSKLQGVFLLQGPELTRQGDFYSLMFFVVSLSQLVTYFIIGWCANVILQATTKRYRRQIFDSVLRQDMQFFDRPENTAGALTSKLSSNPTAIQELMGFQVAAIVVALVSLVASIALAFAYGWKLACVVVFAGLPPLLGSGVLRFKMDEKTERNVSKGYASSASMAGEAIAAIRTVSSLAMEEDLLVRYRAHLAAVLKRLIPSTLHTMAWFALTQSIEFLFMGLSFWYGCQLIAKGEYNFEQFYVVFLAVFFSGQAASQFLSYSTTITKANAAANYVFWIRSLEPTIAESPENKDKSPPDNAQSIALENLRFAYPLRPDAQVLRSVSLDIQPGKFVALVGASGCGKTTIVAMLERFYDPIEGRIVIDETADVPSLSPRLYRDCLSLVQQEPTLYSGTIRENIALGFETTRHSSAVDGVASTTGNDARAGTAIQSDAQSEEDLIVRATHQANAHEFISSLPSGLDTQVGKSGVQLSGGQRQRIAIARALVRNPRILLLDEATSALDTESEKIVQKALAEAAAAPTSNDEKETKGGRITIAVAHRLSTIKDADLICVFLGGKIVEAGVHQDLLDKGGLYAKMVKAQSLDRAV